MLEPPAKSGFAFNVLLFYKLVKYVLGIIQTLGSLESLAPPQEGIVKMRYVPAMYIYTLQDALFICSKQSPYKAGSVAFSQSANSPRLIEDETFNDSDIINNLIDYEDGRRAGFLESG
ncbi:hypothetical protein TNCV_2549191 [Trichonephila clavipes]|nr:hypothetical protein TNCV_2549191 [Trichonephila clavipes]